MNNKLIDILTNPSEYKYYATMKNTLHSIHISEVNIEFSDIQSINLDPNNHCRDGACIEIYQENGSPKSKKLYINKLTKTLEEAQKIIKAEILYNLDSSLHGAYNQAIQIAIKNKITLGNDINNIFHKFMNDGGQDETNAQ